MMIQPLQQKVEAKIHEAVDMINQIIYSTNDSMSDYFAQKHRRVQEVQTRLMAEVEEERVSAAKLLEKMIANSKETVHNLQRYFADVMEVTMEKTYTDIKSILNNAVSKIDTVSRDIKENLKQTQHELGINESGLMESAKPTLAKLFNTGIDSIQKLAFKFKNEPISTEISKPLHFL